MAKELPYFKFEPGAWENGNIQICSFEAQGVFINICSMYWQRLGDLPYRLALIKICRGNEAPLKSLVDNGMIKVSDESISIDFLDAQLQEFSEVREKRVSAGRQGGKNRSLRPEIERIAGSQFYVIYCYKADESFIKFGITSDSISRRFSGKMPYDYEVIFQYSCDDPLSIETECCDRLRQHRYTPAVEFQGYLECYRLSVFDELNDILKHRTSNALAMVKHRTAIRREEKRREEKKKEEKREEEILSTDAEVLVWPSFDDFWQLYDKKIDRPRCEKKWKKIAPRAREQIMEHLQQYIPATPDRQFRKNPLTYLNNQAWENEVIQSNGTGKPATNAKQQQIDASRDYLTEHYREKFRKKGLSFD